MIGDLGVFPLEGRITGPGGNLRVEPKSMAVLVELARHAPGVRTREQITRVVWPRGYISEDVLTRCIGQLRRALGDDPKAPAYLETLPKRGYRLLAKVTALGTDATVASAAQTESLLVVPFQNLSAESEDYIADGVTELLIARLAALPGIRVISRTTAMQFKGRPATLAEISETTGAAWMVEGSVLQAGDRLQVVAQLIDVRTDAHIWAADYVRDLRDLLVLENEIVRRIASAIRQQLGKGQFASSDAPSLSPTVMREYLRGRQLVSRRTAPTLREALGHFQAVTAAVPDYPYGWASMAESEMLLAHYGALDAEQLVATCESHLDRALMLEPDLAIALSTRGAIRFFFKRDFDGAVTDLERALHLLPSYALAMLSLANVSAVRRRFEDASAWMDQALLVDPLDVGINMNVGDHMILQQRYDAAVQALGRALELAPGHRPGQLRLCWALALAGQRAAADALLQELKPASGADPQWHEYAALVAGAAGDTASALSHYRAMESLATGQRVSSWTMARAAAAAVLDEKALAWLAAAARELSSSLPFMFVTPAFARLHGDPRFQALGATLGLPRAD